eukprot:TRINITY_DN40322_c0_g1_i1.p1 TRINITY_DN40322_c0_g1~~TRINITY_DN40322_c0_g1_i1.p1  ORF type:complete len:119 (+),score=6.30 TRINITY_DN40322_c0_g1_i1:278-634(+)
MRFHQGLISLSGGLEIFFANDKTPLGDFKAKSLLIETRKKNALIKILQSLRNYQFKSQGSPQGLWTFRGNSFFSFLFPNVLTPRTSFGAFIGKKIKGEAVLMDQDGQATKIPEEGLSN